jgi:ERCC4-related helicase
MTQKVECLLDLLKRFMVSSPGKKAIIIVERRSTALSLYDLLSELSKTVDHLSSLKTRFLTGSASTRFDSSRRARIFKEFESGVINIIIFNKGALDLTKM